MYVFECVMALIYLLVSYSLLATDLFKDGMLPKDIRLGLGILFGVYGIFRIIRAIRKGIKKE